MTLKFTLQFSSPGWSWSEAHWNNSVVQSLFDPLVSALATAIATARVGCLGQGATLSRVRVSNVPANRLVRTILPPFIPSLSALSPFKFLGANVGSSAILPGAVLLINMPSPVAGSSRIFLGGIPGVILTTPGIGNLGYDLSLSPGFTDGLGAYMAYLTTIGGGWGFLSRSGPEEPPIVAASQGLVTNAQYPGSVGIVTQDGRLGTLVPGTQVDVRGWRRLSLRSPGLSGTYRTQGPTLVASGPPTTWTYFLSNTAQVQPSNFFTQGSLSLHTPVFIPYLSWNVAGATTRKRGARSGAHRGRSSIRI